MLERKLERRGDLQVDSAVRFWREDILPKYQQDYKAQHVRSVTWQGRTKVEPLPAWSLGRPQNVVEAFLASEAEGRLIKVVVIDMDSGGPVWLFFLSAFLFI